MRVSVISPALLLLAVACGEGSPDPSEAPSSADGFSVADALRSDGPLRGVVFTRRFDRKDSNVRPVLRFTTDDTEVTAVIGIGDVAEGSSVSVSWYRVEGLEKRHALFTHQIAVESRGVAFSQSVAPNGLTPGVYDTVATMDGHISHTPFVVHRAAASGTGATGQTASDDAPGDAPLSGDSGWIEPGGDLPMPPGISMDMCRLDLSGSIRAPVPEIDATGAWIGACSTGRLTATVSGPPQTLASSDSLRVPVGLLGGSTGLCRLAGGSDLPGTVVHLAATGSASGSKDITVPDFGESLLADLDGLPAAESKVEPGDRIAIQALAMVMAPALGVRTLRVDAGSELLESVGNLSGSDEPQPCDPLRLMAHLVTEYRVPADAPPIIELCATGVGFDGTQSKNCIRYFIGEVWQGAVTGEAVQAACTPASVPITGEVTLQVASDGKVTGTSTERRPGYTCGGVPVPDYQQTFPITGQKTTAAFELNAGTLPITGSRATMTSQHVNRGYGATVTYTIECASC